MKLKAFRFVGDPNPIVTDVSVVIIEDAAGNPISLACETGVQNCVVVAHCQDKDFNRYLRGLGINKTVICDTLQGPIQPALEGAKRVTGGVL